MSTKSITRAAGGAMPSAASASAARAVRAAYRPSVLNISSPFTRSTRCHSGNRVRARMPVEGEIRPDQVERAAGERQRGEIGLRDARAARQCAAEREPAASGARLLDLALPCSREHRAGQVDAEHGRLGKARARSAGGVARAAARVQHGCGETTLMYSRRSFMLRDLARQERDRIERGGTAIEDPPQAPSWPDGRLKSKLGTCRAHWRS